MRLRSTDLSARSIGGETIVLHLPDSRYFSITGIGTRVFELLSEDRTMDDLVEAVVGEYEVDAATARRDIEKFVAMLRDARLLA